MKLFYKPVSILVSVLGGILAGAVFKQVWKLTAGDEDAPKANDKSFSYGKVLLAATIQGAIFALVKAALERGAANATLKLTGFWPGTDSEAEKAEKAEKEAQAA